MVYGRLDIDERLARGLAAVKGHVELYMHPVKSRDPQDTIFIEHIPSDPEFEIDAHKLHGVYTLYAGIFTPNARTAIAQIPCATISAAHYKERVQCTVHGKDVVLAAQTSNVSALPSSVALRLTVFDEFKSDSRDAPKQDDFRAPKEIEGAEVTVVGYPEWGSFFSDAHGNVRIPKEGQAYPQIPPRSELMLEVKNKNYYSTRSIIPIFSTNAYSAIYLVHEETERDVSFFTQAPQLPTYGLILGRVFDPKSSTPLAGEVLDISPKTKRTRRVFIGALPDLKAEATLASGLYGFFNVPAAYDWISRPNKHSMLVHVEPKMAYFVEFGRGGKKGLFGKLQDPFSAFTPQSRIQLVGDALNPVYSDAQGKFRISDIDLPPGLLTLEMIAGRDYAATWYSVPWSTRETATPHHFPMVEEELLTAIAKDAHVSRKQELGTIMMIDDPNAATGGLSFPKGPGCITVDLQTEYGLPVSAEHGPFPLLPAAVSQNGRGPLVSPVPGTSCLNQEKPGFAYFNLAPGLYQLRWRDPASKQLLRTHLLHVGMNRVSVVVN
jgi:hypothetical protein